MAVCELHKEKSRGRMRKTSAQYQTGNGGEWEVCSVHVDIHGSPSVPSRLQDFELGSLPNSKYIEKREASQVLIK